MIDLGISNSSPFIVLGRVGRLDLLHGHFRRMIVPGAVAFEVGDLPSWVVMQPVVESRLVDAFPARVHRGEAEVLLLGLQHPGSVLVIDDWYARRYAQERGITVIGTVGLILRAKRAGRIQAVRPILDELISAGFHISRQVFVDALRLSGEE